MHLESRPTARLYADNRGNGAVEVGWGQLRFPVAAGSHTCMILPCSRTVCSILLDGKEVGTAQGQGDLLVDCLGTRTYRLRDVVYGSGSDVLFNPGRFQDLAEPAPTFFRARHVHRLPDKVDYFLEPAPEQIQVLAFRGIPPSPATRKELVEKGE